MAQRISGKQSSQVVRPVPTRSATYTAGSRLQAAGLGSAVKLFAEAAAQVPLPPSPQPIVIADYGAATGHNALPALAPAITALRRRTGTDQPIMVTHTDVPDNDFTAMFRVLAEDPDTYLHRDAVFSSSVGRSFYAQVLPSGGVSLGWSAWAVQWLSEIPVTVADHVLPARSADPAVRDAFARQAARDWHEFVAFRGRELRPGGRLVLTTMAIAADGDVGYGPLLGAVLDTLAELRERAVVTEDEVHGMCIPVAGRREQDFVAPFAPSGTFEKLSIGHLEVFDATDRFHEQYRADGDAAAFGARWADFAGAVAFPTLTGAVSGADTTTRRATLLAELRRGVAERLAADPLPMRIPLAQLVIEKGGDSARVV